MPDFSVLTTRKRTIIALVHTVVFLSLAVWQTLRASASVGLIAVVRAASLHVSPIPGRGSAIALTVIYLIVSSILWWLVSISRTAIERVYFGFCATSASFGLLRALFGSSGTQFAQYVRVTMLACAIIAGFVILRMHGAAATELVAEAE
jgi:hypothetical protein